MPSIAKAKDYGLQNLDTRVKPAWELLDLTETRSTFEAEFAESVMTEFTDIAGFTIEYWVFVPKDIDKFYGEVTTSNLSGPYRTKILMEPFKEPYLISVMGFQGDQKSEYAEMPKATFLRDVQEQINRRYDLDFDVDDLQPKPQDVIHCLWNDEKYEITSVNSAEKIFQGRKHTWSFILRPYRVNQESRDETELLTSDLDFNDFDDRNETYKNLTLKDQNIEKYDTNKKANKASKAKEVDPEFYGYKTGIKTPIS